MKKMIYFLLALLCVMPYADSLAIMAGGCVKNPDQLSTRAEKVTLKRAQESVISAHKLNIQNLITSNKYKSYGIKGAAAALIAYLAYKSYQAWNNPEQVVGSLGSVPCNQDGMNQLAQGINLLAQRMQGAEGAVAAFGSWAWFKRNGALLRDHILSTVAATSLWAVGEKYFQSVNHADSVEWFARGHTNIVPTIEELRQCGMMVDSPQFIEQGAEMRTKIIAAACNSLISQIELIMAYMEYKQEQLTGSTATQVTELIRYTFNCTNEFAGRMETVLNDLSSDGTMRRQAFENAVNGFKKELDRTIMRYHHIEREQSA